MKKKKENMNLEEITTAQLKEELKKRSEKESKKQNSNDQVCVAGLLCVEGVVSLSIMQSAIDAEFLDNISIRSRLNPHMKYRIFYFKTDRKSFNQLHEAFVKDNEKFTTWVENTNSITIEEV